MSKLAPLLSLGGRGNKDESLLWNTFSASAEDSSVTKTVFGTVSRTTPRKVDGTTDFWGGLHKKIGGVSAVPIPLLRGSACSRPCLRLLSARMGSQGSPVKSYDYLLKFLLVGDSDVGKGEILDSLQDGSAESPYAYSSGESLRSARTHLLGEFSSSGDARRSYT